MFSRAASNDDCKERNFSNRTSLTVWVTRGLLTICKVPSAFSAFFTSCTSAPKPELSTKSILDKSKIMLVGPSSIH